MTSQIGRISSFLNYPDGIVMSADIRNRLATRHEWFFGQSGAEVLTDISNLLGPQNWAWWRGLAVDAHTRGPVKFGIYAGGMATPDSHHASYEWLGDADMLHHLDGTQIEVHPAGSPAVGGERRLRSVNYGSADTRAMLCERWVKFCQDNSFDGIVFDTYDPVYYAARFGIELGCPTGALEGAVHTQVYWATMFRDFALQLKAAFAPYDFEVWGNGLNPASLAYTPDDAGIIQGPQNTRIGTYLNGALAEAMYPAYVSSTDLAQFIATAASATGFGSSIFYFFQPELFDFSGFPWTATTALARFYLAAYLLVADANSRFGYHDQGAYRGWSDPVGAVAYLFDGGADWDQTIGAARSGVTWDTSGGGQVAIREYERAYVVVNADTTSGNFTIRGNYRDWHPTTGTLRVVSATSPTLTIPPRTGLLLFKEPAVLTWSRPMRAILQHLVQDEDGNIQPHVSATILKSDGAAFDQTLYDAPSGGTIVTSPETNSLGLLQLYCTTTTRVKVVVGGVTYESEFVADPDDDIIGIRAGVMTATGGTAPVLTLTATSGGAGGNKGLKIINDDASVAAETKPHAIGGTDGATTNVALHAGQLVIGNGTLKPRLLANLTAAAGTDRLQIQSSVPDGTSDLGIMPNGAGAKAAITLWARSTLASAEGGRLFSDTATGVVLESLGVGVTAKDIIFRPNQVEKLRLAVNGNVLMPDAGLLTTDTTGFLYIASCNGTPTGAAAITAGTVPMVADRAASKLWIKFGATWKGVALT